MKMISDMAGIRLFEGIYIISAALLLYGFIDSACITAWVLLPILYFCYSVIQKKSVTFLKSDGKFVLITGCDSGFGNGLAKYLNDLGISVLATCYDENSPGSIELKKIGSDNLHVLRMDVGQQDSVQECLERVEKICGKAGLWGIVNNAGINFLGDIELCTMKQYLDISNVNMFGMVRVTKAFIPLLRKNSGRIVNVTSVKGRISLPCNSVYGITKYGGDAFSNALRQEMKKFGIKVIIIEPGNFGGATGCLNEEGASRIKKDMDTMWDDASQEIKEVYGQEYHQGLYNAAKQTAVTTCPTLQPVLQAFKDALLSEEPHTRYMIQGGKGFYDFYCIQAIMNSYLPICVMDKWIYKNFLKGLPSLKSLSGKTKYD